LSSTVLRGLEEHVACTEAFEVAAADQGWFLCRNEGTIEEATRRVVGEIDRVMSRRSSLSI